MQVTTTLPIATAPGVIPFAANGFLCVFPGGNIASHVSGIPYGPSGRIVISQNNTTPLAGFIGGLAITTAGRIAVNDVAPVDHYVRGIPVTIDGRVCIAPYVVEDPHFPGEFTEDEGV